MKKVYHKTHILVIVLIIVVTIGITTCEPIRQIRETYPTKESLFRQPILPADSHVSLVFTSAYNISFFGFESLYHFDVRKYQKIYEALIKNDGLSPKDFLEPPQVDHETLRLVHTETYLQSLKNSDSVARYLEFGAVRLMPAFMVDGILLKRFRIVTGGTVLAAHQALEKGIGINIGGGYQHARPATGGGFCIYADVPIAIKKLQQEELITNALIVDVDVHQGDGFAACFAGDESVFIIDMYQKNIYPSNKVPADINIALAPGVSDEEYLAKLKENLPRVLEQFKPDIVFYLGGTDPYCKDNLGGLNLSQKGILDRDMYVVDTVRSAGIPFCYVTSGGYSKDSWRLHYKTISTVVAKYGGIPPAQQAQKE